MWATIKKYNISTNRIQVIQNLYDKATCAVLFNSSIEDWFKTTVGCLTGMSTLTYPLQHIPGNLRFADGINGLAGEEGKLTKLVERLDKASTAYGMEISTEKPKLMTNYASGIFTEIKVNVQKLETVASFMYLGSVITDEGSMPEILPRIAQTTAALTRLKPVWIDKSISLTLSSKIPLMPSLVTSIFLYACEHGSSQQSSKEEYLSLIHI